MKNNSRCVCENCTMVQTSAAVALSFYFLFCLFFVFFCTVQIKGVSENLANYPALADAPNLWSWNKKVLSVALRDWLRYVASSSIKLHLPLILVGGTSHVALSAARRSCMRCVISLLASPQHGRKPLALFIYLSSAQTATFVWRPDLFLFLSLLISVQWLFLPYPKRAHISRPRKCIS